MARKVFIIVTIIFSFLPQNSYSQNEPIIYSEWINDPLRSIVINWVASSGSSNTLQYRVRGSSGNWNSVSAVSNSIPSSNLRRFSANITSLNPGTSYEFRITSISGTRFFRTAPLEIKDPIRFIVGGDITETRTSSEIPQLRTLFEQVTELAADFNPFFAVLGGDFVHSVPKPSGTGYPDVNEWFYLLRSWTRIMITNDGDYMIPIVAVMGNHEVPNRYGDSPNDAIYFHAFFSFPQMQWSQRRGYGVLDFSNYLSIVTLDTDHSHTITSQNNWLSNTLSQRRNFSHVYPVYHVPGWPVSETLRDGTGRIDAIRNEWHPFFRDNNIRFVFEHHDHIYKRTHPFRCQTPINNFRDCQVSDANGVIYLGGGTWGSNVRSTHPNFRSGGSEAWAHSVIEENNNFVVMEISESKRGFRSVSLERGIIDEFAEVFFLARPNALEAQDVSATFFIAEWESVADAAHYRLDVATNSNFSSFVSGYQNRNVGNNTSRAISGLNPGQTYYYRVRAVNSPIVSGNSNTVSVEMLRVDPSESTMVVSEETIEADDSSTSIITVTTKDQNGSRLRNVPVTLSAIEGNLIVDNESKITNTDGEVDFLVRNNRPQIVTYQAIAAGEILNETATIRFIPVAPVALSATEIQTDRFQANWEIVNHTDSYQLDVSVDSSFTEYISGFENLDVGNVTDYIVTGLDPGTNYHYRVRATFQDLIGVNSQSVDVTTFPEIPVALNASDIKALSFVANWEAADGARNYLLDVSKTEDFTDFVEDFNSLNVGNVHSFRVDGLDNGTKYFYRVRSEALPRISDNSVTIETATLRIDPENSSITSSQLRVLANGEQANTIEIFLRSDEGILLDEVGVSLIPQNGSSEITALQDQTDDNGLAVFEVRNHTAEKVTYSVLAENILIGDISLEFLQDEGILKLGNNYPNPFSNRTIIPVTLPSNLAITLTVYNSLGIPVRTIIDDELEKGYYELPFDGLDLAAGIYFYRLVVKQNNEIKTGKMVYIK